MFWQNCRWNLICSCFQRNFQDVQRCLLRQFRDYERWTTTYRWWNWMIYSECNKITNLWFYFVDYSKGDIYWSAYSEFTLFACVNHSHINSNEAYTFSLLTRPDIDIWHSDYDNPLRRLIPWIRRWWSPSMLSPSLRHILKLSFLVPMWAPFSDSRAARIMDQAANHPIRKATKMITMAPKCICDAVPLWINICRAWFPDALNFRPRGRLQG